MAAVAAKSGKVLLYAAQRRFGGAEQAAVQALGKGYAGDVYHARASWMRTRGIPTGTGWFTDRAKSGGGAVVDLGVQMLDLAWSLLGQPRPLTAFAVTHHRFRDAAPTGPTYDVEDAAFALVRFEGGKSLELSASWAINQPPRQHVRGNAVGHGDPQRGEVVGRPVAASAGNRSQVSIQQRARANIGRQLGQRLFGESGIASSMVVLALISAPLGALFAWLSLKPYAREMQAAEARGD